MKRLPLALALVLLAVPASAQVTFRSISNAFSTTAIEPSGAANGDILIAVVYKEVDVTATTPPSGWNSTFNGVTLTATLTNEVYRADMFWIRRGGSTPALTFTSIAGPQITVSAYSGALTSGDPFSFGSTAIRDDATALTWPAVSGTTLDANEMLIWAGNNFRGGTTSDPPTGFTEREDINGSDVAWADVIQTASGATGSVSGATVTSGGSNGPANVFLMGLRPSSGGPTCTPTLALLGVGRCG